MQVYLAALESENYIFENMPDGYIDYGLLSYFYLKEKKINTILSKCKHILIDSGAFTFQQAKSKINFDNYVNEYIEFIKRWTNNPQIEGFFEMDVDNIIGYEKVLEIRKRLEQVSDKIIPVWHNNRGVNNYIQMCKDYSGKRVSVSCIKNKDIREEQYNLFINTAHSFNCKVHLLGMTRFPLIKQLNLGLEDSFDSSSWKQSAIYGTIGIISNDLQLYHLYSTQGLTTINKNGEKINFRAEKENFLTFKKLQEAYKNINNSVVSSQQPHN